MLWKISTLLPLLGSAFSQEVELAGLGKLRGREGVARDGSTHFAFEGVPYADPPTGLFRFRPANQVSAWEGVRDATQPSAICVQAQYFNPTAIEGSEDCLYLNIYTKSLDPATKLPVIVYIHGGAFIFGSSRKILPPYLLEENVVLVTLQYRLGPLGFLSTEDKEAPGNYGLHDQLAALRWIQDHVATFGGNPNLVTVVGMSAGGASVHYLLLSPNSAGLFHRAVSFSGSALCWWANLPNQRKTAISLGTELNCPTSSSKEMLDCLREKSAEEIMSGQTKLYSWHYDKIEKEPMNIWSPRADMEAGRTAVLPVEPHLAIQVGQIQPVPFLVGVDEHEGSWRAVNYLTQDDVMIDFVKNFDEVAPLALGLTGQVNKKDMRDVLKKIKDYYLDSLVTEPDLQKRLSKVVTGMVNMLGDTMFNYPIDRMVKLHGNKDYAPVWMFMFNYKHNHSVAFLDVTKPGAVRLPDKGMDLLYRPTHTSETSLLFPLFEEELGPLSPEETKVSRKFVKFLLEFAVKGTPEKDGKHEFRDWKPVANGQLSHFIFGKYSATQLGLPFQNRMKWWNDLPAYWRKTEDTVTQPAEDPSGTAEELTDAELEEMEVNKIMDQMHKDEL